MNSILFSNKKIQLPKIDEHKIYIKYPIFYSNVHKLKYNEFFYKNCIFSITILKNNKIIYSKLQSTIADDSKIEALTEYSQLISIFTQPEINFLRSFKDLTLEIILENPLHYLKIPDFHQEIKLKKQEKIYYIPVLPLTKTILIKPPFHHLTTLKLTQTEPIPYCKIGTYPPFHKMEEKFFIITKDTTELTLQIPDYKKVEYLQLSYPTNYWEKETVFANIVEIPEQLPIDEQICPLSLELLEDGETVYYSECCKKMFKNDNFEKYLEYHLKDYNDPYWQPFSGLKTVIKCPHCRQEMNYYRRVYRKKVLEEKT